MAKPPPHIIGASPRGSIAGRLLLRYWHMPYAHAAEACAVGLVPWLAERLGEAAMYQAARRLPIEIRSPATPRATPIVFLTGHRYWHETLFCASSLLRTLSTPPPVRIISDGTLSSRQAAHFRHVLPHAKIISTEEVEQHIQRAFPSERFPLIRFYREQKPILRKLIDVFSISQDPQLLIDSDMLFFRRPDAVLGWLDHPREFLAMRDIKEAYGYSPLLLHELAGAPIPFAINIGFFGLAGRYLNWDNIERWIRILTESEGLKYNLCQGLGALLFAQSPHEILNAKEYIVCPSREETLHPTVVLHHYVAESKQWYRRHAWRRFASFS